ncbi:hypothetical protein APR42_16240 [Salegentibacter mishustinae]|uniref:Uncharacterized protein n=1 Tax=Salegentibacter mishustinae TaxID=270918 RepID=A0A0Q9ZBK8_9FLAO|nr:hypothetical protein APR42_16240 [Salegentibacter mishustinae]PNW21332.1 hypothetical protein APB85_08740 [Salegentibacter mishustinae]
MSTPMLSLMEITKFTKIPIVLMLHRQKTAGIWDITRTATVLLGKPKKYIINPMVAIIAVGLAILVNSKLGNLPK